jgi:DNA-binding beta-propeller fold protein YncE
VDTANSRILTLSPSGQWLGSEELAAAHLPFAFLGPIGGIAVDAKGDPLVTDYGSNDVLKRLPEGWIIAASAPVFQPNPSGPELTNPQGVAVDRRGNIYVADQGNSRIQQFSARGELHAVWRISGSAAGTQPYMYGVAVDRHGYVYVTDELGDHVLKLSPHGSLVSQWGSRGSGPGQLRAPQGIAVDDRSGRVYVVDTDNKRIQMFSLAGKYLGSSLARFVRPTNVAVGGQGNVYVTDAGSRRLEKFSP